MDKVRQIAALVLAMTSRVFRGTVGHEQPTGWRQYGMHSVDRGGKATFCLVGGIEHCLHRFTTPLRKVGVLADSDVSAIRDEIYRAVWASVCEIDPVDSHDIGYANDPSRYSDYCISWNDRGNRIVEQVIKAVDSSNAKLEAPPVAVAVAAATDVATATAEEDHEF